MVSFHPNATALLKSALLTSYEILAPEQTRSIHGTVPLQAADDQYGDVRNNGYSAVFLTRLPARSGTTLVEE